MVPLSYIFKTNIMCILTTANLVLNMKLTMHIIACAFQYEINDVERFKNFSKNFNGFTLFSTLKQFYLMKIMQI